MADPPRAPSGVRTREVLRAADGTSAFALVVVTPEGPVTIGLPAEGELVIGRGSDADVPMADDSVSRRHATLRLGNEATLEDHGSRNGTSVMGSRLLRGERRVLPPGCVIEVGTVPVIFQRGARVGEFASRGVDAPPAEPPTHGPIVHDAAMKRLYALVQVIAVGDIPVLILGETGVGKELLAEAVHRGSARRSGPYLRLNCASLPESLLESELFGHEKGAFTGAVQAKAGLLESAHGGTVFLDEIGEVTPTTQAKLLRALENGQVMRIGSLKPRTVDVRFVSATNRDLPAWVRDGLFRADLYFRLNGITLTIPALRRRLDDIVPLAESFVARACLAARRPPAVITPAARAALLDYAWPGNIRELRNRMDRAVLLAQGGAIHVEHVQLEGGSGEPPAGAATTPIEPRPETVGAHPSVGADQGALKDQMGSFERARIVSTLERCLWNQTRAAKLLGVSRRTLVNKLDLYQIARPRKGRNEA